MTNQPTISQRLHEQLAELIASKESGERLPAEPKLASSLGVSRATLREAMRTFETQGLIRRRQGSGTYVTKPTRVIKTGLEVLESIDRMADRIGLSVTMQDLEIEHRRATRKEAEIFRLNAGDRVINLTRVISTQDRSVAYLIDVVPDALLNPADLDNDFTGSVLDLFLQRGVPILENSRCEISAVTAPTKVARALGIQRGDVLLFFSASLYNSEGKVVDFSQSYFLPGYFRFHVIRSVG